MTREIRPEIYAALSTFVNNSDIIKALFAQIITKQMTAEYSKAAFNVELITSPLLNRFNLLLQHRAIITNPNLAKQNTELQTTTKFKL